MYRSWQLKKSYTKSYKPHFLNKNMEQEMVSIPKKEYEELLEELGIVRNPELMAAIKENEEAKKMGVKTWKLQSHK